MKPLYERPLPLLENRVWRMYTGGRVMGAWRGREEADGHFPEDWIGSVITSNNATRPGAEDEGLSRIDGKALGLAQDVLLKELIERHPAEMLGKAHVQRFGAQTALLVKALDASTRLAIQAHPTREDALRHFGCPFGKTEAWYVLAVRDQAKPASVRLGFREGMTRERWRELFDGQDVPGMVGALHEVQVHPGDVLLLEGGVPHAIGEGCFLMEIQEPTDYTFRVERVSPLGLPLRDEDCHQGAGFENMFDMFRYDFLTQEETLKRWQKQPRPLLETEGGTIETLLDAADTPCFALWRMRLNGSLTPPCDGRFRIAVVTGGEGTLEAGGDVLGLHQGDSLFLPAALEKTRWHSEGGMEVLLCLPPETK